MKTPSFIYTLAFVEEPLARVEFDIPKPVYDFFNLNQEQLSVWIENENSLRDRYNRGLKQKQPPVKMIYISKRRASDGNLYPEATLTDPANRRRLDEQIKLLSSQAT